MTIIRENELTALRNYQSTTSTTAIYPKEHALSYLTLGLYAELAEFVNAENSKIATSEVGDIMWFLSELANLVGTDLSVLIQIEDKNWSAPVADTIAAAMLVGELAEVSGVLAKHLRDGSPYAEELTTFLHHAIQSIYSVADIMSGVILPEDPDNAFVHLLVSNREKLLSRQQRGVLGGSGNNR